MRKLTGKNERKLNEVIEIYSEENAVIFETMANYPEQIYDLSVKLENVTDDERLYLIQQAEKYGIWLVRKYDMWKAKRNMAAETSDNDDIINKKINTWVRYQIEAGQPIVTIIKELIKNGWNKKEAIRKVLKISKLKNGFKIGKK